MTILMRLFVFVFLFLMLHIPAFAANGSPALFSCANKTNEIALAGHNRTVYVKTNEAEYTAKNVSSCMVSEHAIVFKADSVETQDQVLYADNVDTIDPADLTGPLETLEVIKGVAAVGKKTLSKNIPVRILMASSRETKKVGLVILIGEEPLIPKGTTKEFLPFDSQTEETLSRGRRPTIEPATGVSAPVIPLTISDPTLKINTPFCQTPHRNTVRRRPIDMLILHYTADNSARQTMSWFCTPKARASSNYIVDRDGTIYQMVPDNQISWHAGFAFWRGKFNLNASSLGIEIVNLGHPSLPPYPPQQMEAVLKLSKYLIEKYQIPTQNIVAHSDVSYRKSDPGDHFPWASMAAAHMGFFPSATTGSSLSSSEAFSLLEKIGYRTFLTTTDRQSGITSDLAIKQKALVAFCRRYCPEHLPRSSYTNPTGAFSALVNPTLNVIPPVAQYITAVAEPY